jgi:hypothetical protein
MSAIMRPSFQDLLGGDAEVEIPGFVYLPWLHPMGQPLRRMRLLFGFPLLTVSPPLPPYSKTYLNKLIALSVDGKWSKSKQRWGVGVCDDIAAEGIFTGGMLVHSPDFVQHGQISQHVVELLALIAGLEWGCQKQKQKLFNNKHLLIVSDCMSWVANYKELRLGRVRFFDAVGFEGCLSRLMAYVTRACLHFEDVTIIHKSISHHANFSPKKYVPDVLAVHGLRSDVAIEPMRIADDWRGFTPIVDEQIDSEGLCVKVVFANCKVA